MYIVAYVNVDEENVLQQENSKGVKSETYTDGYLNFRASNQEVCLISILQEAIYTMEIYFLWRSGEFPALFFFNGWGNDASPDRQFCYYTAPGELSPPSCRRLLGVITFQQRWLIE